MKKENLAKIYEIEALKGINQSLERRFKDIIELALE